MVKNFWPHRSKAKGFSIEKLARKYREKISIVSSNESSNQFLVNRNLRPINEYSNQMDRSDKSKRRGHWANRDFSEYREAA
tara:strand:+ start:363 stop:605 length:243 start_codon:yes stop_codon:yes gene_type:complete